MKNIYIGLCILAFSISPGIGFAEKITIFTEIFPPYNFVENDQIVGVSAEVIKHVFDKSGYEYEIKSYPWARSYKLVQQNKNSMIFSISRRANREKLFKWVGEIAPTTFSVFVLKSRSDIVINQLTDMKQYKIGTSIEDARENYLLNNGFSLKDFDRVGGDNSHIKNFKKLMANRIELWPMPDAVMNYIVKKEGFEPSQVLRKAYMLSKISGNYYLAANLETSDEIVMTLRKILAQYKKTPSYAKLLKKWGL